MNKRDALIIGLGQIGMGYDYDQNDSNLILTHASGYFYHPNYNLIGGIDTDSEKRLNFEKKYKVKSYSNIEDFSKFNNPKIVSITVPTYLHYQVFCSVVSLLKPEVIICEKPICDNLDQAKEMIEIANKHNIILVINYNRRFDPGVHELKKIISSKEIGSIFKGVVWYSKGLKNNASHFIDLIIFLFGEIKNYKILYNNEINEKNDPEPEFVLEMNNGAKIYFLTGKEECYTIAEMTLLGTKGRAYYLNGGEKIMYSKKVDDPVFPNYKIISDQKEIIKSEILKSFWYTLDEINKYLIGEIPRISCTKEDGFETLKYTLKIYNDFVSLSKS